VGRLGRKTDFDGKGNLVGFRGADTDITHRKTIEDRLVRREGELMNVIASAPARSFSTGCSDRVRGFALHSGVGPLLSRVL
jgi:hypothetical protein